MGDSLEFGGILDGANFFNAPSNDASGASTHNSRATRLNLSICFSMIFLLICQKPLDEFLRRILRISKANLTLRRFGRKPNTWATVAK